MTPVKVIIARHLPTPANEGKERLRGQGADKIDTDKAKELAPQMADVFDREGVNCIYCSDLPRGIGTAKAIESYMQNETDITPRAGLRTWDVGKYTGKLRDDMWKKIEKHVESPEIPVPGDERFSGESFQDFVDRFNKELLYQLKDAAEDGHNAWILHGNQAWTLEPILEGRNPELDDHISPAPGSIFRLEFQPDGGKAKLTPIFDSGQPHKGGTSS